jgi:hypothetical protein
MRRNSRKNHILRRAVTPVLVGCMTLGVPAGAALSAPASADAATTTATAATSSDPLGQFVASIEANLNYYECLTLVAVEGVLETVLGGPGGYCIQPPPVGS